MGQFPLLELEGIEKSFDGHKVLKGITLSVMPGEFMTFLGPSGCGKTTTLRLIGGFDEPDSGAIRLQGQDVTRVPAYRRDVHTVFQHYALFPHYDVFENVAFSLRLKGTPEGLAHEMVREALSLVRLSDLERRRIDQLSGGQQQRVALARALVGRPSLLLLDEPLGALDLKLRRQMQLELKRIQRKLGIAFIYVTHDQEEALTLSDRIAVFSAGEIVQLGDPKAVYESPRTAFVADFIGSANVLEAELTGFRGGEARLLLEGELELLVPRPDGIELPEGGRIPVAIRPERLEICSRQPGKDDGFVGFKAVVKESVYLGSASQVILSPFSKSDKLMTAHGRGDQAGDRTPGAEVWLKFKAEDLLILTRPS